MTPTKPTQLKHYVDITSKQYLYHIKIFTSVLLQDTFSHVKKTSFKSLYIVTSYNYIFVAIKAIILGPKNYSFANSSLNPLEGLLTGTVQQLSFPLVQMFSKSHRDVAFQCPLVLKLTIACCLQFPEVWRIFPLPVTGSAGTKRQARNGEKSVTGFEKMAPSKWSNFVKMPKRYCASKHFVFPC